MKILIKGAEGQPKPSLAQNLGGTTYVIPYRG